MPSRAAAVRRRWPDLRPNPSLLRAWLDLSQAEMAAALGVSVNTWARWERGVLAIHPGFQLVLDLIEQRTDRDAERTANRLRAPSGVRNLW